jgi:hypothetical protein
MRDERTRPFPLASGRRRTHPVLLNTTPRQWAGLPRRSPLGTDLAGRVRVESVIGTPHRGSAQGRAILEGAPAVARNIPPERAFCAGVRRY